MSSHAPLLVLAVAVALLSVWLAIAYRRNARVPFPTDRRRRRSRSLFWLGATLVAIGYGWFAASAILEVPAVADLDPLTIAVAVAMVGTIPLLAGVLLAMPTDSWE